MINLVDKVLAQGGGQLPGGGGLPGGGQLPFITPPPGLPTDVCALLDSLTNFAFQLSIVIAPFFVLWAAWLFISSAGNEQQITTARKIILYVVIGLAVVLVSRGLVLVIQDVLGVSVSGLCGSGLTQPNPVCDPRTGICITP